MQKHRISTNIGKDQRVTVEIKQDYDLLEILSLKFSQQDVYTSLCADYGVVCGRITANDGFGIPNAKVSIFVPQLTKDSDDPVISALYPYTSISEKNENNYRYNLLPARKQHGGHVPTGTFPDQTDILTREEYLEVYETYYSYTVKTNESGDFMIWGVPLGQQTINVDIDLSDIGCFSLRPYDFIKKGVGIDQFDRYYNFKSGSDVDGLPQIVNFQKTVEVYPFWGNIDLCQIGITRTDFDLLDKGIKIEPISLILTSTVTDDNGDAIKRNGVVRRKSGYKCNLQTTEGRINAVRYTGKKVYGSDKVTLYPELEYFNPTESIDTDGTAMVVLPMNMEYVYTNEFGEQEITNDINKGIPTTTCARFKFTLDSNNEKTSTAKYLVPQIREYNTDINGGNYYAEYEPELLTTYQFSNVFEDYLKIVTPNNGMGTIDTMSNQYVNDKKALMLGTNNGGVPEDVFYKFIFGKVYTVSSFQGSHYETSGIENFLGLSRKDAFLGIKEIRPNVEDDCASKANYFPTNFAFRNRIKFGLLVGQVLLFLQFVFSIIINFVFELLGRFFIVVGKALYGIYFGWPFNWRPFAKIGEQFQDISYKLQSSGTQTLSLTIYPDCEECTTDADFVGGGLSLSNQYCSIGEVKCKVIGIGAGDSNVFLIPVEFNLSTTVGTSLVSSGDRARDYDPTDSFMSGNTFALTSATSSGTRTILNSLSNYTITPTAGDTNNCRFIADAIPNNNDTIIPYTTGNGDTIFKSVSVSNFQLNFTTSTALGDIAKFQTISSYGGFGSWQTNGKYGSYVPTWVNYVGSYSSNLFEAITYKHQGWAEISGFNYEGYSGAKNGEGSFADRGTYVVLRIYDRSKPKINPNSTSADIVIEEGCAKYDKSYDETQSLSYLWAQNGIKYGNPYVPVNPPTYPTGFLESPTNPNNGYTIMADIIANNGSSRMPRLKIWEKLGNTYYNRKTKSGYSEIRDGVFTVIPIVEGSSKNYSLIKEWYKRKRVGVFFCGGVVNYSFIDNWLNGILYFFKFDKRIRWDDEAALDLNQRGSKYPRELVFYNVLNKEFYYRATPYTLISDNTFGFVGQKYTGYKEILHPTTFYDVGVRDEFLYEICQDPRVDPTCSVVRDIHATSYQDPANIVEYAINYRLDVNNGNFDVGDFFTGIGMGSNVGVFDGDITQLMSINCEAGIEAFDLDSPHYFFYNGEIMDPEDPNLKDYFTDGSGHYGPTPIDLKLDNNGAFIRQCLNFRLGDYTQKVPFYLWNKLGEGFGSFNTNSQDDQTWDKTVIAVEPLQRLHSISGMANSGIFSTGNTTNYVMADGEEEYLLKPITKNHPGYFFDGNYTDMLERFENISYSAPIGPAVGFVEGDVWLQVTSGTLKNPLRGNIYVVVNQTWTAEPNQYINGTNETFLFKTINNYIGNKQVLSTPFLFYFGLRPDKTSLDTLIKYYGPKGAFPSTDSCVNIDVINSPSLSPSPTPTGAIVTTPTPTPTVTPSSTIGLPSYRYYELKNCNDDSVNGIKYSIRYSTGTYNSGDRVFSSSQSIPYVITSTLESIPNGINTYDLLQITRSYDVDTLQPLYGCPETTGTTTTTPGYTRVTLIRGGTNTWYNGTYAKAQLCGNSPMSAFNYVYGETTGGDIFNKYIDYNPTGMTPSTLYNVWDEQDRFTLFDGGNRNYGVMIPEYGSTITYIVEVSPNGQINNWRSCT